MAVHPRFAGSLAATLAVVLYVAAGVGPARAAGVDAPKLGIRLLDTSAAYISLTLRPGETKQVHVELGNYGTNSVTARSYVADVYSMINGGMGVRLSGEPTSGTTAWLTYPAKTLHLGPRQARPETVTVSVPSSAAPGDYISALVIEGDAGTSQSGDTAFKQVDRQAVAVAIRVPGAVAPRLSLPLAALRTTPGGVTYLDLGVDNTGNSHLHLSGSYSLLDATGTQIAGGAVSLDTVYADTSTVLAVPLTVALAAGHYTISLTLSDPKAPISASSGPLPLDIAAAVAAPQPAAQQSTSQGNNIVLLIAGTLGIGFAFAVALVCSGYILVRRHRRREPSGLPTGP